MISVAASTVRGWVKMLLQAFLLVFAAISQQCSCWEHYRYEPFIRLGKSSREPANNTEDLSSADVSSPSHCHVDINGDIYYSESFFRPRVRKVSVREGLVRTVSASLQGKIKIWVDTSGQLFVVDGGHAQVIMINNSNPHSIPIAGHKPVHRSDGRIPRVLPASEAVFYNMEDICGDMAGNLFIADGALLRMIDSEHKEVRTIAGIADVYSVRIPRGPTLAANTTLFRLRACTVDSSGNVYVADGQFPTIRKIDRHTGVMEVVAGTGEVGFDGDDGPAIDARLGDPEAMWIDSTGGLFVTVEYGRSTSFVGRPTALRRVDLRTGVVSTLAGYSYNHSRPTGVIHMSGETPFIQKGIGLCGDPSGTLYMVALQGIFRLYNATRPTIAPTQVPTAVPTLSPHGRLRGALPPPPLPTPLPSTAPPRAVDAHNAVVEVVLRSYTGPPPHDKTQKFINNSHFDSLSACAVDLAGNIHIARRSYIAKTNLADGLVHDWGRRETFKHVSSLWVDTLGATFAADLNRNRIIRIDVDGLTASTVAGGRALPADHVSYMQKGLSLAEEDDGAPTAAILFGPQGVCGDTLGNIFIADTNNHRVRRVNAAGSTIASIAGTNRGFAGDGGDARLAQLNSPCGCAVNGRTGDVFIADCANRRIRMWDRATRIITTIAGNGGSFESQMHGSNATVSAIGKPCGVWLDPWENLFILTMFAMSITQTHYSMENGKRMPYTTEVAISSPFQDKTRLIKLTSPGQPLEMIGGGGGKALGLAQLPAPARSVGLHSGWTMCGDSAGSIYIAVLYGLPGVIKIFDGHRPTPAPTISPLSLPVAPPVAYLRVAPPLPAPQGTPPHHSLRIHSAASTAVAPPSPATADAPMLIALTPLAASQPSPLHHSPMIPEASSGTESQLTDSPSSQATVADQQFVKSSTGDIYHGCLLFLLGGLVVGFGLGICSASALFRSGQRKQDVKSH